MGHQRIEGVHHELRNRGHLLGDGDRPDRSRGDQHDHRAGGDTRIHRRAAVGFSDCRVPADHLLGERGRGFQQFLEILDEGRIAVAAMAVGLAQGCLDHSLAYAKERQQFGRPIGSFQAIAFKIADMQVAVDAARLLTYRAAWLKDQGKDFKQAAAIAKLYASEAAVDATRQATQIFGGYGFMDETPVARFYRDAKVLEIGEGTSEVQRMVIAKTLGL
jgi:butyryl-CoA dehydrogenase